MSVKEQLLDLYAIQQIDKSIFDLSKERDEIPTQLEQIQSQLADQEAVLSERDELISGLKKEIKALESLVEEENIKLHKWEKRLKDISTQREYLALSREIDGARRTNDRNEEQILELFTQVETAEGTRTDLAEQWGIANAEVDAKTEASRSTLADLDTQIDSHGSKRNGLADKIPARLLKMYDRVRIKRMGVGMTTADAGRCTSCNMKLPPQLYNKLMRFDSLEQCPSCQRVLAFCGLIEEVDQAAATETA